MCGGGGGILIELDHISPALIKGGILIDLSLFKPLHGLKTVVVKNVHVFGVMDILCFVSEFLCTHRQMPEMK